MFFAGTLHVGVDLSGMLFVKSFIFIDIFYVDKPSVTMDLSHRNITFYNAQEIYHILSFPPMFDNLIQIYNYCIKNVNGLQSWLS